MPDRDRSSRNLAVNALLSQVLFNPNPAPHSAMRFSHTGYAHFGIHEFHIMYTVYVSNMEGRMPGRTITLKLNQQQLELIDRTIATGIAPDRQSLVKLAIREQAERQGK